MKSFAVPLRCKKARQPARSFVQGLMLVGLLMPVAAFAQRVDEMEKRLAPCMTCHGKEGRAASDGYYPRIAGKPEGYLYNQLLNFREGRRQQYPLMVYMVQHLSDAYLLEMAKYFSRQNPPYPPPQPVTVAAGTLERGRVLATVGDSSRQIPSCASCHGAALTGVKPSIPGLLGLPRDYINAQFGAWRDGARRAHAPDCMAQLARRMSPEDISAVSAWLASQPVPKNSAPVEAARIRLPLACGSVTE